MRTLLVATGNAGKLREFSAILTPVGIRVEGPPAGFHVDENGDTFVANAIKKAQTLMARSGQPSVGDDSGLEVDALAGAPGVLSARYAGVTSSAAEQDAANRRKLLQALAQVPTNQRTARFVCVLAYCAPQSAPMLFSGAVSGHIAVAESGHGGFGYDPIFIPAGGEQTFADMAPPRKNAISHRGQALRALAAYLQPGH